MERGSVFFAKEIFSRTENDETNLKVRIKDGHAIGILIGQLRNGIPAPSENEISKMMLKTGLISVDHLVETFGEDEFKRIYQAIVEKIK